MRHVTKGSPKLLLVNGALLSLMGALGLVADLASYLAGFGPLGGFLYNDPRAIGMAEAHGLAICIGAAAMVHARSMTWFWHRALAGVHVLLGGCNLFFWAAFVAIDSVGFGITVTAGHFGFVLSHLIIIVRRCLFCEKHAGHVDRQSCTLPTHESRRGV